MPAGGKGDEPYLDIIVYKAKVFSEKADDLIRDLSVLMNSSEILEFRSELLKIMLEHLNIDEFESQLEARKNQLIARATQNGFDLELLESKMLRQKQGKAS
jgi:hypothetical protein